jgi:hypothetical protein
MIFNYSYDVIQFQDQTYGLRRRKFGFFNTHFLDSDYLKDGVEHWWFTPENVHRHARFSSANSALQAYNRLQDLKRQKAKKDNFHKKVTKVFNVQNADKILLAQEKLHGAD